MTNRSLYRAMAALASASFAIAARRMSDAEKAAREAADLLAGTAFGCLRARALAAVDRAMEPAAGGDDVDHLAEAATLFEASGALWRRDRALDALRSKGSAGRRAAATHLGARALPTPQSEVEPLPGERLTA